MFFSQFLKATVCSASDPKAMPKAAFQVSNSASRCAFATAVSFPRLYDLNQGSFSSLRFAVLVVARVKSHDAACKEG